MLPIAQQVLGMIQGMQGGGEGKGGGTAGGGEGGRWKQQTIRKRRSDETIWNALSYIEFDWFGKLQV